MVRHFTDWKDRGDNMQRKEAEFARKLQSEYQRTRRKLTAGLKRKLSETATKSLIREEIKALIINQERIMVRYLTKAFLSGIRDAKKELGGVKIVQAGAKTEIGFDLNTITDSNLQKIGRANIGVIGKFNIILRDDLIKHYDELLSDNKLLTSLNKDGWTPWLGESLKKRGIDPAVISLVKHQKTTGKMLTILNEQGIRGGLHPDQVARKLMPHIQRYFGPGGVEIDNMGKTVKRFVVDVDGNYTWKDHTITKKFKTTPKAYSRLIAESSMTEARREAYYRSVQKTGLVSHYISVSVMDARTCGDCACMHGVQVSHADGPSYHPRCHCTLRPVFKRNSILGDKNKPERFYEKQRDMHFLRLNDLKRFNTTMPTGSKLKHFSLLPDNALTMIMPGPLKMRPLRDALMGHPEKVAPLPPTEMKYLTNDEWKIEAKTLYAKTEKDHVEHMRVFTPDGAIREFKGTAHECPYVSPKGPFSSLHTHPSKDFDSPLSDTDMSSFLASKGETQMAATSGDTIYVITKNKGFKPLTQIKQKAFEDEFNREVNRLFYCIDADDFTNTDYHNVYLESGQELARRYGLDYTVIQRKP